MTPKADELDTTNYEDAGFYSCITGILSLEFAIKGPYDAQSSPYESPSALAPGGTLSNTRLYINDTSGAGWTIPTARILEAPNTADIKQLVMLDVRAKGSGSFSVPSGAA